MCSQSPDFSLFPSFGKSGYMEYTKISTNVISMRHGTKVSMRCGTVTYKGRKQTENCGSLHETCSVLQMLLEKCAWIVISEEVDSHCDKGNILGGIT